MAGSLSLRAKQEPGRRRRLRILLAEDNRINQQFAKVVLSSAGHGVEIAGNGREAVELFACNDFDLVLMDIQMPEVDGVEATRRIRALPKPKCDVPIVALTAHAMAGVREEYLAAGMNDYIAKPFKPAELLSCISAVVGKSPAFSAAETEVGAPRAIAANELPVLDLKQLDNLGLAFSLQRIRSLASLYLLDIEARLKLIREFRTTANLESISRQAHMIVSTAGNLGLNQTSAFAHQLEVASLERDRAETDKLIDELNVSCQSSSRALQAWLDRAAVAAAS